MSDPKTSEKSVYLDREEHFHRGQVGAKTVVPYYYDSNTDTLTPAIQDLVAGTTYDYIDAQQTDPATDTYVFKTGGSGGTAVQTITISYTDANKTDLDTVVWS